jgi:thioredoxin 1
MSKALEMTIPSPQNRLKNNNNNSKNSSMVCCVPIRWRRVLVVTLSVFCVCAISRSSLFVSAFVVGQKTSTGGSSIPTSFFVPRPWRRDNNNQNSRRRRHVVCLNVVGKTGGRLIETIEEYEESVLNNSDDPSKKPVMVFFTAPWCGPCRLSVPAVKDVMKEFAAQLDCVEVCTDDLPEVAAESGVVSIPTIQLYSAGNLVDTIVGCVAKTVLASSVEKVLEDIQKQQQASKKKRVQ